MIEKLTLLELMFAGSVGMACFWMPGRQPARLVQATRLERLRRSRWQYLAILGIMLILRIQRTFPPALELTVGLLFLVMLAFPVRQVVRLGNRNSK